MTEQFVVPAAPRRFDWRRFLLLFAIIALIAACGIGMVSYFGYRLGVVPTMIGLTAAILPVPLLVGVFQWLDRYEPEPWKYLAFCFGWGSCVATAAALVVNNNASDLFNHFGESQSHVATLIAPFIEETGKAAGPLLLFLFRRRAFSGPVDGIVYFGLSAVGFAMMENILYMSQFYLQGSAATGLNSGGVTGVVTGFLMRIVLTGFAHPLFTVMTGLGFGFAALSANRAARWFLPLTGWLLAMMLHGTWNTMATLAAYEPLVILYGYFGLMMPIFFTVVGVALWLRAEDGRVVTRILPRYAAAAWLSPPEIAALATVGRRLTARYWARQVAGNAGFQAMRGYQLAATKLALLRDRADRGLETTGFAEEEGRLLSDLVSFRSMFTGRDRRTPWARWDGTGYRIRFPDGSVRAVPAPRTPVLPIPVPLPAPYQPIAYHPGQDR